MFGISIDSPGQHAALIEKLSLPFPLLSDPDRSQAIEPYRAADPKDARNIARSAMVVVTPDGEEGWRYDSRDFADRLPEDEVIAAVSRLGLPPTAQPPPAAGSPEPGPRAMSLEALGHYWRGARFAALAMGLRHGHHAEEIKEDSKAYVAELDRFMETAKALRERRGG